ncbi:acetyl-CoA C-acetyltransferase [Actinoplanes regularis]|uniref:Acetyl-CoA C-acetyltransferase n=1 Tax=Actinoplanes regularis TaxID=52697 RepID=A0A238Z7P1_9ACTN|nr:acetyl-CoA C-acetyltransferase [Actinoplanes regularis]GIE85884.1 acetyl-CoA acetyltransferase [Actinoplanes regularis]GLW35095.1 acetyl-CoA acetyltransferase [Actinoplanes regularis]SNR79240.1 acetyl-CoA C-acetyltransferase [Actinoplanes regularis]
MESAYLAAAVRTPVGRRGGRLSGVHPADLAGHTIAELLDRAGVDPAEIDDVVLGCVDTLGPQSGDIARTSWLAAGLPEHVPGVTVDRQCGSGQQAVHFAAQAVLSGTAGLVVAGGVQSMSQVPIGSAMAPDGPYRGSRGWAARYGDREVDQFRSADEIAAKWALTRAELEEWALTSHRRAIRAIDENRFAAEIVPVAGCDTDEGPRRDTTATRMAGLAPLRTGGVTTAATSSQLADGAAALLVASGRALREHGLRPRAAIRHLSARGGDPVLMLTAPIEATAYALARAGLRAADIDRFEVNEAFASVVLAWLRETGADPARVNVNGGAIALGHPLGATGARLLTGLLHELERCGGRYGLLTMCEGGGQANVTIIERL